MTARLTEDSLRTHGGLTHQLTEGSRLEVEGKGDRKWKGVRAEAFHHDYRKVDARDPAPIVAPSPVATQDAMMSLAAIEHLDFEAEIPCDGSWDGELCQNAAFGVVVARPGWEPPAVGIVADDWPVMERVIGEPRPQLTKADLRLIPGGVA